MDSTGVSSITGFNSRMTQSRAASKPESRRMAPNKASNPSATMLSLMVAALRNSPGLSLVQVGSGLVRCWFTVVPSRLIHDSLLVHCSIAVGSLLVPCCFAAAFASVFAFGSVIVCLCFAAGRMLVYMMVLHQCLRLMSHGI